MIELLITICARGGSKGIPGKNIKKMNGKPLLAYSIETARSFSKIIPAIISLSTDDQKIKDVAADFGLNCSYMRPAHLATDMAGKIAVIHDLLLFEEKRLNSQFPYILDLDVTSPLRTTEDLHAAFTVLKEDSNAFNIFSVNEARRNPYFNMVEADQSGYYRLSKEPLLPIKSRQTAPAVFELNASFYFYRRNYFDAGFQTAYTPKSLIYKMPHICFDLDEPIDFKFLEYLLSQKKLDRNIKLPLD